MNIFRDYVTSTAFKLSLSKVQIECLCQIDQLGHSWMLITTFNALAGKGLVERRAPDVGEDHPAGVTVALTDAGRLVIPLLRLAGLYLDVKRWDAPEQTANPIDIIVTRKSTPALDA